VNSAVSEPIQLPSVSVALATHNGAAFIDEQLRSIVAQSLVPFEIVLSDDASHDGTVEIARASFDRAVADLGVHGLALRTLSNRTPLGTTANFENACAHCIGDLIALSDQDDIWEPERLRVLVDAIASDPDVLLVHSDASLIDETGAPLAGSLLATIRVSRAEKRAIRSGHAFDVLLRRNIVTGATTIFRRGLLELARPFPPAWVHDEWLALIAAATRSVRLVDEPLTRYRQHSANQIGAQALTVRRGIGRLQSSRRERNARLLEHATTLAERLTPLADAVHPGALDKVAAKVRHERFRSALPDRRAARLLPILGAVIAGRYRRYSRGPVDAVRDLVQPA
jgi:glycosyltransferase involved in cell wall biosynthesis